MAELRKVPCRKLLDVRRGDGEKASDDYVKLLEQFNRQRFKSRDEILREEIVSVDKEKAYESLISYRKRKSKLNIKPIELREVPGRCAISPAKFPFLRAIQEIIRGFEEIEILPGNDRQIHYGLVNSPNPPLRHASKPNSRYRSDKHSYASLVELLTRARHEGYIDYEDIDDATRPDVVWPVHRNLADYYHQQLEDLFMDYWRDLLQSQPNHIQAVIEKNTMDGLLRPIFEEYAIPYQIGRGMNTTRPIYNIAKRFKESGKEKLTLITVGDLGPDGVAIPHALGQRLRDDHGIKEVEVIHAALTMEQAKELNLPVSIFNKAKKKSPNYKRYVNTYGTDDVWDLEAVPPLVLKKLITDTIDAVIDTRAFNHELKQAKEDAKHLAAVREIMRRTLRDQINH
jgi:hypothetical protein